MRSMIIAALCSLGAALAGCGAQSVDPSYVSLDHPCATDSDCRPGTYCGDLGVGTQMACGGPDQPACETGPRPRYCFRQNSGECCPPSAAPAP